MYGNLIPIFNISFSRKTQIINHLNNNNMAQYNKTSVKINGVDTTIKSGDIVLKDGIKYRFEWKTYQFERWANLSREPHFQQQNFEGGICTADSLIKTTI